MVLPNSKRIVQLKFHCGKCDQVDTLYMENELDRIRIFSAMKINYFTCKFCGHTQTGVDR